MTRNALANLLSASVTSRKSLDEELKLLCEEHGFETVQLALRKQRRVRRGRKPEKDTPLLAAVGKADATAWLAGKDPFEERGAYQIAMQYAKENPGHSREATVRRIQRKLSQERRLRLCVQLSAREMEMTLEQRQRFASLAMEAAPQFQDMWLRFVATTERYAEGYRSRFGEPAPIISFEELVNQVLAAEMSEAADQPQPRGLLAVPSDKMSSE